MLGQNLLIIKFSQMEVESNVSSTEEIILKIRKNILKIMKKLIGNMVFSEKILVGE